MDDQLHLLFHELADLSPGQRDEYFRAHEVSPDLRTQVETLLGFDSGNEHTLTNSIAAATARLLGKGPSEETRCGPYRLISLLGRGGMGSVYLAERTDGEVEQQVAVKLLSFGRDEPAFRDRFLRERQILAKLSHPLIGRLLDAGHTVDGQPYLVMEYIDGVPVDIFAQGLDLRGKLALFQQICDAVSHAHRNLIVHRDLKPSNILVDREGRPKLLDFGIAKVLDAGPGQDAQHTATMLGALTPQYASPEQVRGEPITTASDVYSLGVLLYKLLTDRLPYELPTLAPAIIDHVVCEVEPAPPRIDEDLDNILLMALRKEPARRYLSVQHFADDIDRARADRPVLARPDTIRYRAAKFIRRNRIGFTAVVLTLAAIIGGSAVAIREAQIASRRFQDVRKLAHTFVFDLHDEIANLEGSTKAREMLVKTGLEYLDKLAISGGSDLDLQREIAAGYMKIGDAQGFPTKPNLGRIPDAIASYRKAGEIYRKIAAKNAIYLPDLGNYYLSFGALLRFTGDAKQARAFSESAIQTFDSLSRNRKVNALTERNYMAAWCTIGDIDEDQGSYRKAWTEFSHCRDLAQAQFNRDRDRKAMSGLVQADERVGTAAQELGLLSQALSIFDEDESLIGKLILVEPRNPKLHRYQAMVHQFRSMVYRDDAYPNLEDPAHALESARKYLAVADEMVKRDPNDTSAQLSRAIAMNRVAYSLAEFNPVEAVRVAAGALKIFDQLIAAGKTGPQLVSNHAMALRRLAQAQFKAGQTREARQSAEAVLAERRRSVANTEQDSKERLDVVQALVLAGETNAATGNFDRAESLLREARDEGQRLTNMRELPSAIPLAQAEQALGAFYERRHRTEEARTCYKRLVELWGKFPRPNEYVDRQAAFAKRLSASLH